LASNDDDDGDEGCDARRARLLDDALDVVVVVIARAFLRVLDIYTLGGLPGRYRSGKMLWHHSTHYLSPLYTDLQVLKKRAQHETALHRVSTTTSSTQSTPVEGGSGAREIHPK
jgi:hypothetical protein